MHLKTCLIIVRKHVHNCGHSCGCCVVHVWLDWFELRDGTDSSLAIMSGYLIVDRNRLLAAVAARGHPRGTVLLF